jgi:hypothetical protein
MHTHATKHATNRVGKTILENRQILENVLGILSFPSPISRFPSPKIQFSSPKIRFSLHKIRFTQIGFLLSLTAFRFLQRLSAFFNGFPLSPTAFRISPTAFQFSSTAFCFPRNPRKSIYGEKYTKDRYSSFVFFATHSPSFVITDKQYLRDYPTKGRQKTNAPPLQSILMAMRACWSNTDGIHRCGMSRATLEATGRRHWATTHSVSPQWPPGQQQTKQRQKQWTNFAGDFNGRGGALVQYRMHRPMEGVQGFDRNC